MKKSIFIKTNQLSVFILALSILTGLASCSDDESDGDQRVTAISNEVITIPFFIENEGRTTPVQPGETIYEIRKHDPINDMKGNHMTLADFSTVRGRAEVKCTSGGVDITVNLSGLIPGGVYTLWHVTFNDGGLDPSKDLLNIRGIGVIGKGDGTDNYFTASGNGTAQLSAFSPTPADLSMVGDIDACPLTDEVEWHIIGSYHLDGKTWGPNLGPDGTAVEQFGFVFKMQK